MYEQDNRTVLTLDAGGTNLVFSAMRGCREIARPVRMKSVTDDVGRCLDTLVEGFRAVEATLDEPPVAISFAFPGPADSPQGWKAARVGGRSGAMYGAFPFLYSFLPSFIDEEDIVHS